MTEKEIDVVNLIRLSGHDETIPLLLIETTLDGKPCTCIATLAGNRVSPLAVLVDSNEALFSKLGKLTSYTQAVLI